LLLVKKKFLKPTGKLCFVSIGFLEEDTAKRFSRFAELRNILAHEYLDIKWDKITKFIEDAFKLFPHFIEKTKEFIKLADK